jgi:hypothetical protein
MANKQQRKYSKLKLKTQNGGANPIIGALEHGENAFLQPSQAIALLKKNGSRSWKISKRHPNNVEIGKR